MKLGTFNIADSILAVLATENVAKEIALCMDSYRLIVDKSTVPVETGEWVEHTVRLNLKNRRNIKFDVASSPEFLREGQAIHDLCIRTG